ncbi:unnamed protein product [Protopolystoma xenopodis]|uniref:Uncharacterized protein n=1 Tax=Protopolystoma xenopodis TaxID=117903 RepID=A0A3S5BQ33_9PLAT|nr:unnamed protein product [Protopolystoma xenopodis]
MVLRLARLTDGADYDAGEMSGNVPRPRSEIIMYTMDSGIGAFP